MGILFFYPLDFTFVCPSEIIAFNNHLSEFKSRGVEVIGVSVDSHFSHLAWKNTAVKDGGIGNVQYPLVADLTKQIARDYDVLIESVGVALRGRRAPRRRRAAHERARSGRDRRRADRSRRRIVRNGGVHERRGRRERYLEGSALGKIPRDRENARPGVVLFDADPVVAAQSLCDQHVGKMLLEEPAR